MVVVVECEVGLSKKEARREKTRGQGQQFNDCRWRGEGGGKEGCVEVEKGTRE